MWAQNWREGNSKRPIHFSKPGALGSIGSFSATNLAPHPIVAFNLGEEQWVHRPHLLGFTFFWLYFSVSEALPKLRRKFLTEASGSSIESFSRTVKTAIKRWRFSGLNQREMVRTLPSYSFMAIKNRSQMEAKPL